MYISRHGRYVLFNLRSTTMAHRMVSNKFISILEEKQLLKDYLPQNKNQEMIKSLENKQTIYAGFDPTGPSLHIGNLLVIMTLIHALRNGHKVICLIGGATAQIGDPSGKLKARESLSRETIENNAARISSTLASIFAHHLRYFWKPKFSTPLHEPIIVNNLTWYDDLKLLDFLSQIGSAIKIRNLARKSFVEERSENLTFSQFSYQVIQGYDWLRLFDKHNCHFQVGGTDQTQNIEAGFSLIRNARNEEVYGLFVPLLLDKEGNKMGKTEGKSLFLDRFVNSPYSFYKAILKLPHSQIRKFFQYFTFYTDQEIEGIIQKDLKKQNLFAHEKLANSLTLLIHGESGLKQAKNTVKALLKGEIEALGELTEEDLVEVFGSDSFVYHELEPEITSLSQVIMKTNCFESEALAHTMIKKGGVIVNNKKLVNPDYIFSEKDVFPNNLTFIQIGTKRAYLIRWL